MIRGRSLALITASISELAAQSLVINRTLRASCFSLFSSKIFSASKILASLSQNKTLS